MPVLKEQLIIEVRGSTIDYKGVATRGVKVGIKWKLLPDQSATVCHIHRAPPMTLAIHMRDCACAYARECMKFLLKGDCHTHILPSFRRPDTVSADTPDTSSASTCPSYSCCQICTRTRHCAWYFSGKILQKVENHALWVHIYNWQQTVNEHEH